MKFYLRKIMRVIPGLFLYALGITITIQANIGVSPWHVFHQGLSNVIGITFGQAIILVGLAIIFLNVFLGEKVGVGTILNMLLIGLFVDAIFATELIGKSNSILVGTIMLTMGMIIISFATWFYIGAGMGSGPRDGLMVALTRKTNCTVGLVRSSLELVVLGIGFLLGGHVGVGTVIFALCIGPIMQITFKLLKFNIREVKHTYIINSKDF